MYPVILASFLLALLGMLMIIGPLIFSILCFNSRREFRSLTFFITDWQ